MTRNSYIIDCNVVVKWYLEGEEHSNEASDLLNKASKQQIELYSPEILIIEFANVLSKYNKLKLLGATECKKYFKAFTEIYKQEVLNIISLDSSRSEVLDLALDNKLSYFDAEYLYLSKTLQFDLITYDQQLKRIANRYR